MRNNITYKDIFPHKGVITISNITPQQYLAALIEIYRGYHVNLPPVDAEMEKSLLKDVLSSAISFAKSERAMQAISEELFNCSKGKCSFQQQIDLAKKQHPEILNAKMTAAAYVMRLLERKENTQ